MKFKSSAIIALLNEDCEDKRIEFVEETPWEDDGKYSSQEVIFKFEDKFYKVINSRSGSYFTGYNYDYDYWKEEIECPEVKKVAKTVYVWENV